MKVVTLLLLAGLTSMAGADQMYQFTITNGSPMPISPGILYVTKGGAALVNVGQMATPGFIQLCQTGNPSARLAEIQAASAELSAVQTPGTIAPGQSFQVKVGLSDPAQSVHFEAMYGETKDTCAVFTVNASQLRGLAQNPQASVSGHDQAIATGAFADPSLPPSGKTGPCSSATSAVACLRLLAPSQSGAAIRFFPGYLPSVTNFLEQNFGSAQTQALLLPVSGGVQFQVQAN